MVIAYHVILSAYGFWLPNDPRGSWSSEVWATHLRRFGPATKVETRHSRASERHDANLRREAKQHLLYPPVRFTPAQIQLIADGFAEAVGQLQLTVHACAVMPDHVHLVTARHASTVEYLGGFLKRAATKRLSAAGAHPIEAHRDAAGRAPTPWAQHGWYIFLNTPAEVLPRIRYVEENPVKAGFPAQRWDFVTPYESTNRSSEV